MKKGVLTVVSGFSGAGKGTLMKALLAKYEYGLSISATTRSPREGEEHGKDYYFLSVPEFEEMIEQKQLIEWAKYVGNYYGTPKKYVEEQLEHGTDVILEIEVQGALNVKEMFPEAVLIFLTPPSAEELKKRLINRGTESIDVIEQRLHRALEESAHMKDYDYIVVNDCLEDCVEEVNRVIQTEVIHQQEQRAMANDADYSALINKIQSELEVLVK